ncbi:hypothetical protein VE00_10722 [Pseudogymnoascus sp. WSF 3629]|nr:hypothetical protein VE00_10722 [Pseudogymnoascus sp. WSF 3629]
MLNISSLHIDLHLSEAKDVTYTRTPFGKEMRKLFTFDPEYRNLNHGSYGCYPRAIRETANHFKDQKEGRPDPFVRYAYNGYLDKSRAAVAALVNAPVNNCVFVPNATTAVNTVLRNIPWNKDGKDEILSFSTIYGACNKTIAYIRDSTGLISDRVIHTEYPISNADYVSRFREAIAASRAEGKNPRVALFDTIASMPGVRIPFEALTAVCKEEGILSLIDGAHSIGQIPLDFATLDPDFFVSNCHKWLFTPRGCAVFIVAERNQHIIRSTLPTSASYVPEGVAETPSPTGNPHFVAMYEWVGTQDNEQYLCVPEAIKWREQVCGGEKAIYEYNNTLLRKVTKLVVSELGTEVLENEEGTLMDCSMSFVRLPLNLEKDGGTVKAADFGAILLWLGQTMASEYQSYVATSVFQGGIWCRLSAQVYLEEDDFVFAAKMLKDVCERVNKGEYLAKDAESVAKA